MPRLPRREKRGRVEARRRTRRLLPDLPLPGPQAGAPGRHLDGARGRPAQAQGLRAPEPRLFRLPHRVLGGRAPRRRGRRSGQPRHRGRPHLRPLPRRQAAPGGGERPLHAAARGGQGRPGLHRLPHRPRGGAERAVCRRRRHAVPRLPREDFRGLRREHARQGPRLRRSLRRAAVLGLPPRPRRAGERPARAGTRGLPRLSPDAPLRSTPRGCRTRRSTWVPSPAPPATHRGRSGWSPCAWSRRAPAARSPSARSWTSPAAMSAPLSIRRAAA